MQPKSPDIAEISLLEMERRPFPNVPEFRISIAAEAYETIHQHGKENTDIEICGVLIGEIFKDNKGPYLEIFAAIRGENAASQEGQVMFTQDTWSHIYEVKDSQYPNLRIVGWYHTHPRYGIFLSGHDLFIHKNFFNQAWQVAYVVDPVSEDEGFFAWQDGSPYLMTQFWVSGKMKHSTVDSLKAGKNIKDTKEKSLVQIDPQNQGRKRNLMYVVPSLLLIILIIVNYYNIKINNRELLTIFDDKIDNLRLSLQQSKPSSIEAASKVKEIIKIISNTKVLSELYLNITQKENHIFVNGEIYTYNLKELLGRIIGKIEGVESVDLRGVSVIRQYKVKPGESLSQIAGKVYGNPGKWLDIYRANKERIEAPDKLKAFTILTLPEVK